MAISTIDIGNLPNDGTGDDLRVAFSKVNENFTEINSSINNLPIEVENLGGAGEGIFANKIDSTLQFKEILGGSNTVISSNNNSIIIDSAGGLNSFFVLTPDGSLTIDEQHDLRLEGDDVVKVRSNGTTVFVELDDKGIVAKDTNPNLANNLQANNNNIQNVGTINANSFIGPLTGLVDGVDVGNVGYYFENFDFKEIFADVNNILDYLIISIDVDFGSFIGEDVAEFDIDFGNI